jgi:hypothetical protein
MSKSHLRLRFGNDGAGSGELFARASADGFAGEGSAYFNIDEIERFAVAISAFPLSDVERPSLSSGFVKKDSSGEIEEHLGISVYTIDGRGHIGVQVRMASPIRRDTRLDSQKIAKLEIVTSYEPLSKFSKDLTALMRGTVAEVRLDGEEVW